MLYTHFHSQDISDHEWQAFKEWMSGRMGLAILAHVVIAVVGQQINLTKHVSIIV